MWPVERPGRFPIPFRGAGLSQSRKFVALEREVSDVLARNTVRYIKRVLVGHHCHCGRRGSDQRAIQVIDWLLTWRAQLDAGTRIFGDEKCTGHREGPCYSQS